MGKAGGDGGKCLQHTSGTVECTGNSSDSVLSQAWSL